jgi:shikimate kinase
MCLILCGLPGCGKTTLGKTLAQRLRYPFIDTDEEIERAYESDCGRRLSCREIARRHGQEYFRTLEKRVISTLSAFPHSVIATGGGTLLDVENVRRLRSLGTLFYLRVAPAEPLLSRLLATGMPSYIDPLQPEESFAALIKEREPLYLTHCDVLIEKPPQPSWSANN